MCQRPTAVNRRRHVIPRIFSIGRSQPYDPMKRPQRVEKRICKSESRERSSPKRGVLRSRGSLASLLLREGQISP
ncbi:hypothetical protein B296_00031627 [Ensete ventricosum]|uniref:Uncharacterized protein n=1 Tax=Ensete ventricosum TaxID=4639 RepID=A0A427AFT4_ENSVE|nr:hypothetical protein B296_00031627 [Ensete ventricosum]